MADEVTAMNIKMLVATLPEDANISEWCRRLGISRQTAYKWRRRFRDEGADGLADRSRAPKAPHGRSDARIEDRVVAIRKRLAEDGLDHGPASVRDRLMLEGVVIADAAAGVMDQHCAWQEKGPLNELFGISAAASDKRLIESASDHPGSVVTVTAEGARWGLEAKDLSGITVAESDIKATDGTALVRVGNADAVVVRRDLRLSLRLAGDVGEQGACGGGASQTVPAATVAAATSLVCGPRITSTSGIAGTGLKKCMPTKFSGRTSTLAISAIDSGPEWVPVE